MFRGSAFFGKNSNKSLERDENLSDYEKYISLLSILKGFEEYTLDKDGYIISSNLEAVNITGYEEWEVIGKHMSIFYSFEDQLAGKPQADLDRVEKHSPYVSTGLRIKKKNSFFWAKIRLRTLADAGDVVRYKMTLQDATHKAVSDHRVKGVRDEYLSLFNNSFVGIFKFNMTDFSIFMMNDKAYKITGIDSQEGVRAGFDTIFDNRVDLLYRDTQHKNNQRLDEWEVQLRHERWVMVSCRYSRRKNFVEGIIVDITPLKKSDREVSRLKNELDQFIYQASHELRSPLVSMLGIINLIDLEKEADATLNLNRILRDKVNQLDDLLRNISSISYNNNSEILTEHIEWENLVRSVLKELQQFHDSRLKVLYNVEQRHTFQNDITRIRTILRSLIANAFTYYDPRADSSWLTVTITATEHNATIKVADNGIGIDRQYQNDIFKMFFKATEYPKGPGLGLYIVKAMVEKLDGEIKVESSLGVGTTFKLIIPNRIS